MFSCYKFNINNFKGGMFGCFYSKNVFILFLLICDFFCCCGKQPYKIIVIGNKHVGKSTLITTMFKSKNNTGTYTPINAKEKITYEYPEKDPTYKFEVWNTCDDEILEGANKIFYKDADGIIAMYDMTNKKSFDNLEDRIRDAFSKNKKKTDTNARKRIIPVLVVSNKSDDYEHKEVPEEEGRQFAETHDYLFLEATAISDSESVDNVFNMIFEEVIKVNAEATKKTDIEQISGKNNDDNTVVDNVDVNDAKKPCWCCDMCKNVN
ncbi:MAG: GTP-binding protein [Cytophagales bacterium]|nr:GTP-binding protein [Cytophagales bacterium]